MERLSLKTLSSEEMEKIEGGTFNWGEFIHGVCEGVTVAAGVASGVLLGKVLTGAGIGCLLS